MGRTNSFKNRGILLKGATTKITSQEEGFPNFLRPLSTAGSPLMEIIFTSLAKSVLLPFELSAAISATDAAMWFKKKKKKLNRNYSINNFKWRNVRYNENSKII